MTSQLNEDLRRMRALIDTPEKWVKGLYRYMDHVTGTCSFCIRGALQEVRPPHENAGLYLEMEQAISQQLPEPYTGLGYFINFNDLPSTTHADVLAVLDRAIEANP